jgi:hypothetical protein
VSTPSASLSRRRLHRPRWPIGNPKLSVPLPTCTRALTLRRVQLRPEDRAINQLDSSAFRRSDHEADLAASFQKTAVASCCGACSAP